MDLDTAKKLIADKVSGHSDFCLRAETAFRYYSVKNDILTSKNKDPCEGDVENPLRNADNRIAFSFHNLLVNQKASYLFTAPPLFDVKDQALNALITDTLGDAYAKKCKDLCVDASNAGIGWVHYWQDEEGFQWAVVPPSQVIPIYTKRLDKKLLAVVRYYTEIDDDGRSWDVYEYWNDKQCQAFRRENNQDTTIAHDLQLCPMFAEFAGAGQSKADNEYNHNFGTVPFIPFGNNNLLSSDLDNVKSLIDAYDKTYSGFVNDLEDIQEIIFVLTNYGGIREEGNKGIVEFLRNLKKYKTIPLDSAGTGDTTGLSTLTIEIPTEARDKLLDITRKAIFDMGQGIDPQQQGFDNTSGEAMKFLYSLLELKAGLMETEFRLGFGELVRAICKYHGKKIRSIIQTWTRTAIRNDAELVDMCAKSKGIISDKTIIKNHPLVDDPEEEEKQLEKERQDSDIYEGSLTEQDDNGEEGGEGDV